MSLLSSSPKPSFMGRGETRSSVVLALSWLLFSASCSSNEQNGTDTPAAGSGGTNGGTGGSTQTAGSGGAGSSNAGSAGTVGGVAGHGPSCGGPREACCYGGACDDGACCVDNQCVGAGDACPRDLGTCESGSCGSCGGLNQPCCVMGSTVNCFDLPDGCFGCSAPGTICPDGLAGGTCVACGHEGEPCCQGACYLGSMQICVRPTPEADAICTTNCGHAGEPCCENQTCSDGSCCLNVPDAIPMAQCVAAPTCGCSNGTCTTCGAEHTPCCDGQTCQPSAGQCLPTEGAETECGFRQGP